jgi:TolA-binding protein
MDGAIDLRLVVSIAGILISLGGALAVTKQSLKVQAEFIRDLETRLRQLDSRTDRLITQIETQAQRVSVLSEILDPQLLAAQHKAASAFQATTEAKLAALESEVSTLRHMHNGKHP